MGWIRAVAAAGPDGWIIFGYVVAGIVGLSILACIASCLASLCCTNNKVDVVQNKPTEIGRVQNPAVFATSASRANVPPI
ncbi:hypothetical protein Bpfe_016560 [Biomphalaria pfeifferi]|uniref:Uncharacterized protein n=1 Tax=Biomphalaria pfeifferi TaxID=112525 RepID=A0AAD8BHV3_BIOPF|nr:hypothetical protein Bpfe_016560 [Biomphalaria pfeifferi]